MKFFRGFNMADFILLAISNASVDGFDSEGEWAVVFTDTKTLTGKLTNLGSASYKLSNKEHTYYLHSSQVIRVYPITKS
jgi:hypothetical protein